MSHGLLCEQERVTGRKPYEQTQKTKGIHAAGMVAVFGYSVTGRLERYGSRSTLALRRSQNTT